MKHIKICITTLVMLLFVICSNIIVFTDEDECDKNQTTIVTINGKLYKLPLETAVSMIVEKEMGSKFSTEAIRAQAIAVRTYTLWCNEHRIYPSVIYKEPSKKVKAAVDDVCGLILCYNERNKKIAFTPYCASVAGRTNKASDIWENGDAKYDTISVESKYDYQAPNYKTQCVYSLEEIKTLFKEKWGLILDNVVPQDMFKVLTKTTGDYNGKMLVGSYSTYYNKSLNKVIDITGRRIREEVLSKLKSPKFEIQYDDEKEEFLFTSYGFGHGVGMSQIGADLYSKRENMSYKEILNHYFPDCYTKNIAE